MRNKLLEEIKNNHIDLSRLLECMNQEKLNTIPFENSWTAGKVVQHMIKSNSGFINLLNGPVEDLPDERKADDQVETIRATFLNFNLKLNSPDFILPEDIYYDKNILLNNINDINQKLNESILKLDLEKLCVGFEIPVLGFLTRLESIHFVISHSRRHIRQLELIRNYLT